VGMGEISGSPLAEVGWAMNVGTHCGV
jgi:hypothetical protein